MAGSVRASGGGFPVAAAVRGLGAFWTAGRRVERAAYAAGAALIASGLLHLVVFAVDGGPWTGPVSWRKPVTFGLSFGLTLVTIAWVGAFVRLGDRARNAILGVFAADCVAEVSLITLQAWRRVPSHFNEETAFDTVVTRMLAAGGGVLVVTLAVLAVAAFRRDEDAAPSMRLAVRSGFAALMLALASGAAMIARGVATVRSGDQRAAYHVVAALKPAHFVTMHAILVLPLLAWLLTFTALPEARRVRAVALASGAYWAVAALVIAVSAIRFAAA
ncbi:hypothetical protein BKA00_003319 [Actinomadura coerulea]|uniref:Uncharacterized protein n=1 Tax=Actinomadura coerulea TaxID=46159 RepID=A0A7X0KZF9_9ACTN|nr:hypothetical protein [Actinomadura coerulea]MBB6396405.1 hypothetical protein [Actinomadura coerulea]GGQ06441.1 hypothetical protein GCM10010187_23110 [Actinomadura coerulea]